MEVLAEVLLFSSLVLDTVDLRFDLLDFVFLLGDELLDSLEGFVTLLHTEERLLPILKEGFLGHDNTLNLDSGFLQGVAGSCSLFFL